MALYVHSATIQHDIEFMRQQISEAEIYLRDASLRVSAAQKQIDQAIETARKEGLSENALFSKDRTDLEAEMKDKGFDLNKREEISASLNAHLENARSDLEEAQNKFTQVQELNRAQEENVEMFMSP